MDKPNSPASCRRFILEIAALAALQTPTSSEAQFNLQTFHNRNSQDYVLLDSIRDHERAERNPIFESLVYHYLHNPVGYTQEGGGSGSLVSGVHNVNFAAEYSRSKRGSLGLDMPIHQLNYHGRGPQFAFGDLRVFGRQEVLATDTGLTAGLVPSLYLPTGKKDVLMSNPNGGAGVNLVVAKRWPSTRASINFGGDYFPGAKKDGTDYTLQSYLGVGLKRQLGSSWALNAEWLGRKIQNVQLGDLYIGASRSLSEEREIFAGGSLACTRTDDQNLEYRFFLGYRMSPAGTRILTKKVETIERQKKIFDCGPKPFSVRFRARSLSERETKQLVSAGALPYLAKYPHGVPVFKIGQGSGHTTDGVPFVKDGQVLFAVDVSNLPSRETVISLKSLNLIVTAAKFWSDHDVRTDMLCLIKEKLCSGDLYSTQAQERVNHRFFSGKEPPNDFFMRQILPPGIAPQTPSSVTPLKLELPIASLLENSTFGDPMNLIYPDSRESNKRHLVFAVAHDIFVTSAQLEVDMSVQRCIESAPPPSIETREHEAVPEEPPHD